MVVTEALGHNEEAARPNYEVVPLYEPRPGRPEWETDTELQELLIERGILLEMLVTEAAECFPSDPMSMTAIRDLAELEEQFLVLNGAAQYRTGQGPLEKALNYFAARSASEIGAYNVWFAHHPEAAVPAREKYLEQGEHHFTIASADEMRTMHRVTGIQAIDERPPEWRRSFTIPLRAELYPQAPGLAIACTEYMNGIVPAALVSRYPHVAESMASYMPSYRSPLVPVPLGIPSEDLYLSRDLFQGSPRLPSLIGVDIFNPRTVAALRMLPVLQPEQSLGELRNVNYRLVQRAWNLPEDQRRLIVSPPPVN